MSVSASVGARTGAARTRTVLAVTGCLAILATALLVDARTPRGASPAAVAARLAVMAAAPGTPPRLAALQALTGRRLDPGGPFDALLAASADRFATVTRAFGAAAGVANAVVASADGSLVFTAHEDGTVRSWDPTTGNQQGIGSYPPVAVVALAYDTAHRLLASGDRLTGVQLWQVGPRGEIFPPVVLEDGGMALHWTQEIIALDFYARGSRLVAVGSDGDIDVWQVSWHGYALFDTDHIVVAPTGATSDPDDDLTFDAAGTVIAGAAGTAPRLLAAVGGGDLVSIDLPGSRWPDRAFEVPAVTVIPRRSLPGRVDAVAVRPGTVARQVAVAAVGGVLLWDLKAGAAIVPAADVAVPGLWGALAYAADGSYLYVAGAGGLSAVPTGPVDAGAAVRAYPGGVDTVAAAGPGAMVVSTSDGLICLLSATHDALLRRVTSGSRTTAFAADGTLLVAEADGVRAVTADATATADPAAAEPRRYQLPAPAPGATVGTAGFDVHELVVADTFVAAAGTKGPGPGEGQGQLLLWSRPGRPDRALPFDAADRSGNQAVPVTLLHLPDRALLVARSSAGEVGAWSTTTWREQFRLLPGVGPGLGYDPARGRLLTPISTGVPDSSPAGAARMQWATIDLNRRTVTADVAPAPPIYRLAEAPNHTAMAVLSTANQVVLTDARGRRTGEPIALPGFGSALAFSPDGSRLAVATFGNRLTVFDVRRRTALFELPASRRGTGRVWIEHLRWDPTGRLLAAVGGTVSQYTFTPDEVTVAEADPASWADRLCRIFAPGLSPQEWARRVDPDLPYRDPCRSRD
jgi:WD40 repeat protein